MGIMFEFSEEIIKRNKLSIQKKEDCIEFSGWQGKVCIYFVNKVEEKTIFGRITEYIKNKGKKTYLGQEVRKITKRECIELLHQELRKISWKNDVSMEKLRLAWENAEQEILNCKYFKISCKTSSLYTESYFFEIEN